jgi:hypothetical protein
MLEELDKGTLGFCFNISSPDARRREIRLLRVGFLAFLEGVASPVSSLDQAVDLIVAREGSTVKVSDLSRRLSCSPKLICDLILAKELRRVPKSKRLLLERDSIRQFLSRRCLGEASYRHTA